MPTCQHPPQLIQNSFSSKHFGLDKDWHKLWRGWYHDQEHQWMWVNILYIHTHFFTLPISVLFRLIYSNAGVWAIKWIFMTAFWTACVILFRHYITFICTQIRIFTVIASPLLSHSKPKGAIYSYNLPAHYLLLCQNITVGSIVYLLLASISISFNQHAVYSNHTLVSIVYSCSFCAFLSHWQFFTI